MGMMMFGSAGYTFFEDRAKPAATFPLSVAAGPQATPAFAIAPGGLHEIELRLDVRTPTYALAKDNTRQAQYNFPVKYTIRSAAGAEVASGLTRIVWNASGFRFGGMPIYDEAKDVINTSASGALGTFKGPAEGDVLVEIEVQPDRTYKAEVTSLELRVYENVRDTKGSTLGGTGLCCISPLLLLLGFALLVYGPVIMATARATNKSA